MSVISIAAVLTSPRPGGRGPGCRGPHVRPPGTVFYSCPAPARSPAAPSGWPVAAPDTAGENARESVVLLAGQWTNGSESGCRVREIGK